MYPVSEAFLQADGIYETIPMGVFEVSEANRTVKCLELRKYGDDPVMEIAGRHRFSPLSTRKANILT